MREASWFLACSVDRTSFKFLCIPVGDNPRKRSTWSLIVKKLKACLSTWRSRQLSVDGKITLINSVLSSLPLYFISFYKAPKKTMAELASIQRQFLWIGGDSNKKTAWVKRSNVCKPKHLGGSELKIWNYSTPLLWRNGGGEVS